MAKGRTTTVTLPDGVVVKRTSQSRVYTHAVAVLSVNVGVRTTRPAEPRWGVARWSSSRALAEQATRTFPWALETRVLPVEVEVETDWGASVPQAPGLPVAADICAGQAEGLGSREGPDPERKEADMAEQAQVQDVNGTAAEGDEDPFENADKVFAEAAAAEEAKGGKVKAPKEDPTGDGPQGLKDLMPKVGGKRKAPARVDGSKTAQARAKREAKATGGKAPAKGKGTISAKAAPKEAGSKGKKEFPEMPKGTPEKDIVKPVALAKELGIKPQIVYGWTMGSLPAYTIKGTGRFIRRSEFAVWNEKRLARKAS
jgi:hypothetical protein